MNRRINAKIIFLLITVVSLCGCGRVQGTTTPEYTVQYVESSASVENTSVTNQNAEAVNTEFTESIAEGTTESVNPSMQIDWQAFSYSAADKDGYRIKRTLKISPMISSANSDYLNAAWIELGEDPSELLTVDYGKDQFIWKNDGVTDALFVVGEISAENITQGYDFSESNPYSAYLFLSIYDKEGYELKPGEINSESLSNHDYPREFTKTMFSTPSLYSGCGGISSYNSQLFYTGGDIVIPDGMDTYHLKDMRFGTARMKSNSWGPISFVMMFPNKHTPNMPNGYELYNYLGFAFGDNAFTLDIIE